ncbi:MAG: hypothetical protein ABFQ65_02105 [Nanoarchaeota archaeon]
MTPYQRHDQRKFWSQAYTKEVREPLRGPEAFLEKMFTKGKNKGQITIFIIVAILIVGIVVGYFALRDVFLKEQIPTSMEPIYTTFLSCVEESLLTGIDVLESQGGYIVLPEFEAGSKYMPFSSQLDFLGNPIPYWYYVSGNNIQKEQVPTKTEMQNQIADFVEEKIKNCKFDNYYEQGFEIILGESDASVSINNQEVSVNLDMNLGIEREEEIVLIKSHKIVVNSNLKKLYDTAIRVYEKEQKDLFLENYGIDILRLYAPVDGVEITCSPKVWSADNVFNKLEEAIESNTQAIKTKSGSYTLTNEKNKYFILDLDTEAEVRFINSKKWSNGFDVSPTDGNVLMAKPVGNQEGLGILGFCYVPYHFVYNVKYPVLTQIILGEEIFQFPMAVVIQGNKPRKSLDVGAIGVEVPELCSYKNTLTTVKTYDTELNEIKSDISYECFEAKCEIGKSPLQENFPQCVNGYILAKAEGFQDAKYLYSTTEEGSVNIIMNKLYEKEIQLNLSGKEYLRDAIITFKSDVSSKTILFPSQRKVELSEGQYEIQVYIYRNSSIKLAETTKQQCIEVVQEGVAGIFGLTKEKCFDITTPAQVISNALYGGGTENYYILESELTNTDKIEINTESLASPNTIEQLQENYILFDEKGLDIYFK